MIHTHTSLKTFHMRILYIYNKYCTTGCAMYDVWCDVPYTTIENVRARQRERERERAQRTKECQGDREWVSEWVTRTHMVDDAQWAIFFDWILMVLKSHVECEQAVRTCSMMWLMVYFVLISYSLTLSSTIATAPAAAIVISAVVVVAIDAATARKLYSQLSIYSKTHKQTNKQTNT